MRISNRHVLLAACVVLAAPLALAQSFRVQCPAITTLHPGACTGGTQRRAVLSVARRLPRSQGPVPAARAARSTPRTPGRSSASTWAAATASPPWATGTRSTCSPSARSRAWPTSRRAGRARRPPMSSTPATHGPNYSTMGAGSCVGGTNAGEACRALADCPDAASAGVACQAPSGINVAATPNNAAVTEPAGIMDMGVLAGNAPAPLMAIDEDDEFFLTLSNPGMIMRPDLFEQHTVHFHGYPNASSYFDGVPDASIAINIAGSFTYYYTAPDPGTYFWHCHITPPEHLQMGMVGQLYVRPRQNRLTRHPVAARRARRREQEGRGRPAGHRRCPAPTSCAPARRPVPRRRTPPSGGGKYAYNDGDGSTRYDVEYPLQMMGFDPNFHYVGMTFNPEAFADMKDKYFLLSGPRLPGHRHPRPHVRRSRPTACRALAAAAQPHHPQQGGGADARAAAHLRPERHRVHHPGHHRHSHDGHRAERAPAARPGRQQPRPTRPTPSPWAAASRPTSSSTPPTCRPATYFLYSTNLDHLSNDAENFGGMMTEIHVN